jgi:hypothetical protein
MSHTKEQEKTYYERKKHNGYYRKQNLKVKLELFEKLGGVCQKCGFEDHRALQIDHVNNDGYIDRVYTNKLNAITRYRYIMADTSGKYQLLCANCNFIKKYENIIEKHGEI